MHNEKLLNAALAQVERYVEQHEPEGLTGAVRALRLAGDMQLRVVKSPSENLVSLEMQFAQLRRLLKDMDGVVLGLPDITADRRANYQETISRVIGKAREVIRSSLLDMAIEHVSNSGGELPKTEDEEISLILQAIAAKFGTQQMGKQQ